MTDNHTDVNNDVDNISFFIDNDDDDINCDINGNINDNINNEFDITNQISNLLKNTNIHDDDSGGDLMMPQILNYQLNFTVRQLLQICEYYGIAKEIKSNKFNKDETIQMLVVFENDPQNEDIVCKRRLMWFYADELKNDKYMKRYIIM
jgi:hypothetical protein